MMLPSVAFFVLIFAELSLGQYENCGTSRTVLLKALFETEGNLYELDRIFLPARNPSSRHIKVKYTFKESGNLEEGNCSVTIIWALGGFLLAQPPKVFQFTSLLFSTPANQLEYLNLILPFECRALAMDDENNCTCKETKTEALVRLTQQLNEYAKYGNPLNVVQDISSSAQAICDNELKKSYFENSKVKTYFAFILIVPFFIVTIIVIIVRSVQPALHRRLTHSSTDHPNLAGITLAGIHILLYILVLDCAAFYYYLYDHEYSDYEVTNEFNLFILPMTLTFDLVMAGVFAAFMMYLYCTQCLHDKCCGKLSLCCLKICLPWIIIPYFYAVFGSKYSWNKLKVEENEEEGEEEEEGAEEEDGEEGVEGAEEEDGEDGEEGAEEKDGEEEGGKKGGASEVENKRSIWIVTGLMTAPLFSLASHLGYISVAWITEPEKTTAAFLGGLGSFLYLFIVFRQCYTIHKQELPLCNIYCKCVNSMCKYRCEKQKNSDEDFCCCYRKKVRADQSTCCCVCDIEESVVSNDSKWRWLLYFPCLIAPFVLISHVSNYCVLVCLHFYAKKTKNADFWNKDEEAHADEKVSDNFSIRGFFLACGWGWVIVGILVFVISAFFYLPIPTFQLAQYLETTVQIVIVVLALLITYKVFTIDDSDIKQFMKRLRVAYYKASQTENRPDNIEADDAKAGDIEAGGHIFGKVARRYMETHN